VRLILGNHLGSYSIRSQIPVCVSVDSSQLIALNPRTQTSCSNAPNWATLGFAAGDNVTLQSVSYTGPNNSTVYSVRLPSLELPACSRSGLAVQCADVTLAAYHAYSTSKPEYTCENVVSRTTTRGGQTNEEGLALGVSGASRDGSDGLAPVPSLFSTPMARTESLAQAAAGGIGAGVTLAVVALLALAAFFLGGVRLFRNGNKATDAGHPVMHQHSRDDASVRCASLRRAGRG
jgi:hypothetical protein